jgi:hypothetical protein
MKKNWLKNFKLHFLFLIIAGMYWFAHQKMYLLIIEQENTTADYGFMYWFVLIVVLSFLFLGIYAEPGEEKYSSYSAGSFGNNKDDGYVHPSDGSSDSNHSH